jgi:hypothetical protein
VLGFALWNALILKRDIVHTSRLEAAAALFIF